MNRVILMGRLTRDPEVRYSQESVLWQLPDTLLQWTEEAAEVRISDQTADFINCVAFDRGVCRKVFPAAEAQTGSYVNKDQTHP